MRTLNAYLKRDWGCDNLASFAREAYRQNGILLPMNAVLLVAIVYLLTQVVRYS